MNFLHPWAIGIGAAAIALPVLIHFLTKPRPKTVPLSTIRFVQNAVRQRRARNWLRDVLVLLFRGLAIACIAWAFAQPRFSETTTALVDDSAKLCRVVILDSSQSMAALDSGVDQFQVARVQAAKYLKSNPGLKANLILAGANPEPVFETLSTNMNVLSEALSKAQSQPQRLDVQAAINAAAEMLSTGSPDISRELVVVSDFQRTNWSTVDFTPLPESTKITLESTAPAQTPDNVAILSVGFSKKPSAGSIAQLEIEVGNFSKQSRQVNVEVALEDTVAVIEATCPPNSPTVLKHEFMVQDTGWQTGVARLLDNEDALRADDHYPFVTQSLDTPTCVIVTRQPPRKRPSSSYFLERALSPADTPVAGQMQIRRIGPGRFSSDAVSDSQLIVLDHPGRLQQNQLKSLASLVRRGRGVMYVASEPVDATNLKILYKELGSDLRAPVEMLPPSSSSQRKSLTINRVKQKMRPFNVFGDSIASMLADVRISGGLSTRRLSGALDEDVLATLSDQSVMLFSTPVGLGNFCVFNVDLSNSNLPRHPTFVPIVNELAEDLLRSNGQSENAFCGEPLVRLLPPSVTSSEGLSVVEQADPPSPTLTSAQFRQSGDGVVWNWRRPTGPSVFEFKQDNQTVFALASHLAPQESDLRTLDADVITDRLSGGREIRFNRIEETTSDNDRSWIWFALAATLALVGEVIALKCFRT